MTEPSKDKVEELTKLVRRHLNVFYAIERADTAIRFMTQPPSDVLPFIMDGRSEFLDEEIAIYRQLDAGEITEHDAVDAIKNLVQRYYVDASRSQ